MRNLVPLLLVSAAGAACSVPDKQPFAGDAGVDAADTDPAGTPETRITSAPAEFSNLDVATFEFEASKPGARFECSIDGESPIDCTSPFSRTLADGPHTFSVRAVSATDDADDTPAEHIWMIDTVAPITTITEAPPSADNSTMVHFAFISNEMNVTFECALDGAGFTACRNGDEFGPIGDGAHSFSVRARDRAGNLDASPALHTWSVDTSTPDTTLLSGPVGASASSTATFSFLSPDAGPGASFECSLDGSAFAPCTSPVEYSGLEMGAHTFAVRVRDATGNLDPTPATRNWTVDLTAPETTITDAPSGTISMASASISFTTNEPDVTFACSLDGAAPAPCTSPFNVTMLSQGPHTFTVAATDMAGHTDPSPATATWTVDTVTPDLAITAGPASGETTGPRVVYTWTSSEGTFECRFAADGAWMPCTSPLGFNAPAGDAFFSVRATDAAGNTSTLSRSFTIVCAAPDTTGAAGLLHLEDNSQILANATGGASATLGPTDQPEAADPTFVAGRFGMGLAFNPGESDQVAWPLSLGVAGTFTFELWASPDGAGGSRDVLVTGDNRVAIRVSTASADTVRFTATVVDTQGAMHTATSATYTADQWHHVVVSLAEPTLRLWVDGDRTEITDARLGMAASLDALRLGGSFSGSLDEIWIGTGATTADDAVLARYCPAVSLRL